jgi:type I restriction enzyme, S subunit
MEWIKEKLGDVCRKGKGKIQTGPFGSQLHQSDYSSEGIPVVMPADIIDGKINTSKIARVSKTHVARLKRHKLSKGDIVFGRRGDIGRQALVQEKNAGWLCGTGCLKISLGKGPLSSDYLHRYLSTSSVVGWVKGQAIGATMPNLNTAILERIPIIYPQKIQHQKKIAAVLSAYDDLIENNQRRIALLEKMAEEIYREWFVRFRFPGHEKETFVKGIPEGWRTTDLGAIADLTMGQSPKSEFYNQEGNGLPFNQGVGTYGNRFPNRVTYCSTNGRKAKMGDILFSVRAPVGRLNIADRDMIIGRGLAAIRHKNNLNSYLYYLLKIAFSNEDIIGNGAIFNSVGKDELKKFKIFEPDKNLVIKFNETAKIIDQQIYLLTRSLENLTKTRNLLLPRLISGKLSVENLAIQFPPSMQAEEELETREAAHA